MQVRAIREGFYGNQRRMPGDIFNMVEKAMNKDRAGKLSLPTWVEDANKKAPKAEEEKHEEPAGKGQQVI